MLVNWFFRKQEEFFSIENLFAAIFKDLPAGITVMKLRAPRNGARLTTLVKNCVWAMSNQAEVNHITGDINYIALSLKKSRTILTIHDLRSITGSPTLKKRLIKLLWFTLPASRASYVTVVSEATRSELLKYIRIDPARVRVIPDCVSPLFTYTPKKFNEKMPALLHVGTTDNKNIRRLAQALKGINCRLKILGRVNADQIRILNENGIAFQSVTGLATGQVVDLYRECDLVCFVSTFEGFGLPIIEGNAVGRPVITSSVSSMPEVAGDAAILVDPYNISEIRAAVLHVLSDSSLRDELIAKGLNNAKRFSPKKIAALYAELYGQVYRENDSERSA